MAAIPRPSRLRFSLRTLFVVVTVVCVWLGWQINVVRERNRAREWIVELGGHIVCAKVFRMEKVSHFPEFRRCFGDEPVVWIGLARSSTTWEQRNRVARLFPEAHVYSGAKYTTRYAKTSRQSPARAGIK